MELSTKSLTVSCGLAKLNTVYYEAINSLALMWRLKNCLK